MSYERYLLYRSDDLKSFRETFSARIAKNREAWTSWVNGLPFYEWTPLFSEESNADDAAFLIGMLCILYIDGDINISFSNDARCIQRQPATQEENDLFWNPPGVYKSPEERREERLKNQTI